MSLNESFNPPPTWSRMNFGCIRGCPPIPYLLHLGRERKTKSDGWDARNSDGKPLRQKLALLHERLGVAVQKVMFLLLCSPDDEDIEADHGCGFHCPS